MSTVKLITTSAEWAELFSGVEGSLPVILLVVEGRWSCPDKCAIYWLDRAAKECLATASASWAMVVVKEIPEGEKDFLQQMLPMTDKMLYYLSPDGSDRERDDLFGEVFNLVFHKLPGHP